MGLDMYLYAREANKNLLAEDVGYWRKANQVHNWFVQNVQNGEDDCGEYVVTREQLKALRDLCEEVLQNKERASELLPSRPGFFFGSTAYEAWYYDDLVRTLDIIGECMKQPEGVEFIYHSSW